MKKLKMIKEPNIIFFLDKIIYPETIDEIIFKIKQFNNNDVNLKFVAILPEVKKPYSCYPFSLSLLFDCIERVIQRKGHETLYGDPKLIASVIIRCFH